MEKERGLQPASMSVRSLHHADATNKRTAKRNKFRAPAAGASYPCSSVFIRGYYFDRQFNGKPAAFAGFALHDHTSAMRFHDVFHDAQSDRKSTRLNSSH